MIDLDNPPHSIIDLLDLVCFGRLWLAVLFSKENGDLYLKIFDLLSYPSFECYFTVFRLGRIFRFSKADKITETNSSLRVVD